METPEASPRSGLAPIFALYPIYQKEIEECFILDRDFVEVCEDYLEVLKIMESWERDDAAQGDVVEEYRELLAGLEFEIIERLEEFKSLI